MVTERVATCHPVSVSLAMMFLVEKKTQNNIFGLSFIIPATTRIMNDFLNTQRGD